MRNIIRKIYWDIAIYDCTGIILIGIMSVTVWRQNMTAQRKTTFRTYKVFRFHSGNWTIQQEWKESLPWKKCILFYKILRLVLCFWWDFYGLALLQVNVKELQIYYYDFEQQFSSTVKVQIPDFDNKDVNVVVGAFGFWQKLKMKMKVTKVVLLM